MARLRLLGGATIEDEAGVVQEAVARRHPIALLAVLAAEPSSGVNRSKLVGLLWPDSPEDRARSRLNSCVYRVRRTLGEETVLSVGDALELNPDALSSDLADFERALEEEDLERAVGLHEGPFLDGFRLPGSAAFEHWTDRVRDRVEGGYRGALEGLAERAEERGETAEAVRWWRERAREDPYDARVVGRLMRALAAAGNRAEALRVADVHARLLAEELGAGPSDEVRALAERLRAGGRGEVVGRPPSGDPESGTPGASGARGTSEAPEADASGAGPTSGAAPLRGPAGTEARRPGVGHLVLLALVAAIGLVVWQLVTVPAGSGTGARDAGASPATGGAGGAGRGGAAPGDLPALAVLPFDTLGTAEASPFAAGLHEDLLTRLANVSGLRVVSATSASRFRDADLPLPAIAESLGVTWVVEGGVQRSGDGIQVHAQLIDPRTDAHAWADSYRRELTAENLFRIQADIATAIVQALKTHLTASEQERLERVPTGDLEAYRLYVEGRRLLNQRTESKMGRAVDLFRRALERDSSFALAWAGLADAAAIIPSWGYQVPGGMPDREAAARRALELEPDLAEAHAALAHQRMQEDLGGAIRGFERAVRLKPSYGQAHRWLAVAYWHAGRPEAALEAAERAAELDPHAGLTRHLVATFYLSLGRYEEALREAQGAPELQTTYPTPELEGWILYHLGRLEEARTLLVGAPGAHNRAVLALVHIARGDSAGARRLLSELEATADEAFWVGLVRAGLGDVDGAFEAFGRVEEWRGSRGVVLRYYFPEVLGPVRADPRYGDLLWEVDRSWGIGPGGA